MSSIALLDLILRAYGAETRRFLPTRLEEGYGLSAKGIDNRFLNETVTISRDGSSKI